MKAIKIIRIIIGLILDLLIGYSIGKQVREDYLAAKKAKEEAATNTTTASSPQEQTV